MTNQNYDPHPDLGQEQIKDKAIKDIIDIIARNNHEKWAQSRKAEGFRYGETDDDVLKTHHLMKPYDEMTKEEKESDYASAESVVKFLLANGYTLSKRPVYERDPRKKLKWRDAEEWCYEKYYDNVKKPDYRIPFVIGLSGQQIKELDAKKLKIALDRFVAFITGRLDMASFFSPYIRTENKGRLTPIYVVSALETSSEKAAADYLEKKHNIPVIKVVNKEDGSPRKVIVDGDKAEYMISNCFMLLSLWDGVDRECPAGKAVRRSLLEYEQKTEGNGLVIGDTCPVYQIVMPTEGPESGAPENVRDYLYKSRLLLPHTLESGENWYMIHNARRNDIDAQVSKYEKGLLLELISETEYEQYSKGIKETIKEKLAAELKDPEGSYAKASGLRNRYKAKKALKKKLVKRIEYNFAVERSKKKTFSDNIDMLTSVNKSLKKAGTPGLFSKSSAADRQEIYDLMRGMDDNGTEINLHGNSRSADIVNLRHLRYDTVASERQKRHRSMSVLTAFAVAAGLAGYGIFSDLCAPNSYLGVIGGLLSALSILIALIVYFNNTKRKLHSAHVNLRLISECLRVKVFWNLVGLEDKSIDDYFTERQQLDLDWAKTAFRAWDLIDRYEGFYDTSDNSPVPYNMVCKLWLGTEDGAKDTSGTKYIPSNDGQISFYRKRSNDFVPKSEKYAQIRSIMSSLVVILTIAITVVIAVDFLRNHPPADMPSIKNGDTIYDFTDNLLSNKPLELLESFLIFIIGIIPAWTACILLYKDTRKFAENAKRYKWMAVKYQKLISCFNKKGIDNAGKREVFEEAGKAAIRECADWTSLISDSDINLPF